LLTIFATTVVNKSVQAAPAKYRPTWTFCRMSKLPLTRVSWWLPVSRQGHCRRPITRIYCRPVATLTASKDARHVSHGSVGDLLNPKQAGTQCRTGNETTRCTIGLFIMNSCTRK